jgi:hypothetical protein
MKRIFALLVFSFTSFIAHADEAYDFYQILCSQKLSSFEIQKKTIWNIGGTVWPGAYKWKEHVDALKNLEKSDNLYVFNELYGYYDSPQTSFDCGQVHATIKFSKQFRGKKEPVGSGQTVRVDATIRIDAPGRNVV